MLISRNGAAAWQKPAACAECERILPVVRAFGHPRPQGSSVCTHADDRHVYLARHFYAPLSGTVVGFMANRSEFHTPMRDSVTRRLYIRLTAVCPVPWAMYHVCFVSVSVGRPVVVLTPPNKTANTPARLEVVYCSLLFYASTSFHRHTRSPTAH